MSLREWRTVVRSRVGKVQSCLGAYVGIPYSVQRYLNAMLIGVIGGLDSARWTPDNRWVGNQFHCCAALVDVVPGAVSSCDVVGLTVWAPDGWKVGYRACLEVGPTADVKAPVAVPLASVQCYAAVRSLSTSGRRVLAVYLMPTNCDSCSYEVRDVRTWAFCTLLG